eukprot:gene471-1879_t
MLAMRRVPAASSAASRPPRKAFDTSHSSASATARQLQGVQQVQSPASSTASPYLSPPVRTQKARSGGGAVSSVGAVGAAGSPLHPAALHRPSAPDSAPEQQESRKSALAAKRQAFLHAYGSAKQDMHKHSLPQSAPSSEYSDTFESSSTTAGNSPAQAGDHEVTSSFQAASPHVASSFQAASPHVSSSPCRASPHASSFQVASPHVSSSPCRASPTAQDSPYHNGNDSDASSTSLPPPTAPYYLSGSSAEFAAHAAATASAAFHAASLRLSASNGNAEGMASSQYGLSEPQGALRVHAHTHDMSSESSYTESELGDAARAELEQGLAHFLDTVSPSASMDPGQTIGGISMSSASVVAQRSAAGISMSSTLRLSSSQQLHQRLAAAAEERPPSDVHATTSSSEPMPEPRVGSAAGHRAVSAAEHRIASAAARRSGSAVDHRLGTEPIPESPVASASDHSSGTDPMPRPRLASAADHRFGTEPMPGRRSGSAAEEDELGLSPNRVEELEQYRHTLLVLQSSLSALSKDVGAGDLSVAQLVAGDDSVLYGSPVNRPGSSASAYAHTPAHRPSSALRADSNAADNYQARNNQPYSGQPLGAGDNYRESASADAQTPSHRPSSSASAYAHTPDHRQSSSATDNNQESPEGARLLDAALHAAANKHPRERQRYQGHVVGTALQPTSASPELATSYVRSGRQEREMYSPSTHRASSLITVPETPMSPSEGGSSAKRSLDLSNLDDSSLPEFASPVKAAAIPPEPGHPAVAPHSADLEDAHGQGGIQGYLGSTEMAPTHDYLGSRAMVSAQGCPGSTALASGHMASDGTAEASAQEYPGSRALASGDLASGDLASDGTAEASVARGLGQDDSDDFHQASTMGPASPSAEAMAKLKLRRRKQMLQTLKAKAAVSISYQRFSANLSDECTDHTDEEGQHAQTIVQPIRPDRDLGLEPLHSVEVRESDDVHGSFAPSSMANMRTLGDSHSHALTASEEQVGERGAGREARSHAHALTASEEMVEERGAGRGASSHSLGLTASEEQVEEQRAGRVARGHTLGLTASEELVLGHGLEGTSSSLDQESDRRWAFLQESGHTDVLTSPAFREYVNTLPDPEQAATGAGAGIRVGDRAEWRDQSSRARVMDSDVHTLPDLEQAATGAGAGIGAGAGMELGAGMETRGLDASLSSQAGMGTPSCWGPKDNLDSAKVNTYEVGDGAESGASSSWRAAQGGGVAGASSAAGDNPSWRAAQDETSAAGNDPVWRAGQGASSAAGNDPSWRTAQGTSSAGNNPSWREGQGASSAAGNNPSWRAAQGASFAVAASSARDAPAHESIPEPPKTKAAALKRLKEQSIRRHAELQKQQEEHQMQQLIRRSTLGLLPTFSKSAKSPRVIPEEADLRRTRSIPGGGSSSGGEAHYTAPTTAYVHRREESGPTSPGPEGHSVPSKPFLKRRSKKVVGKKIDWSHVQPKTVSHRHEHDPAEPVSPPAAPPQRKASQPPHPQPPQPSGRQAQAVGNTWRPGGRVPLSPRAPKDGGAAPSRIPRSPSAASRPRATQPSSGYSYYRGGKVVVDDWENHAPQQGPVASLRKDSMATPMLDRLAGRSLRQQSDGAAPNSPLDDLLSHVNLLLKDFDSQFGRA